MAEYYPLLVRAVSGLAESTPDARRSIYERARAALLGQLRAVQPPVPEADIERESRSLDDAIARIEDEIATRLASGQSPAEGAKPAAAKPAVPPPSPESRPPEARPLAEPKPPAVEKPSENSRKPLEPLARRTDFGAVPRPPAPPRPSLPPRPGLTARPGVPQGERPAAGSIDAARSRPNLPPRPWPQGGPPPAATGPDVKAPAAPPASAPQSAAPDAKEPDRGTPDLVARNHVSRDAPAAGQGAPDIGGAGSRAPMSEADIAASRAGLPEMRAERKDRRTGEARPVNVTLRKFGPRAEAAASDIPAASDASEDVPLQRGATRPAAPQRKEESQRNLRPWLIGLPIALVAGSIAVFAYVRRDNPDELARMKPAPSAEQAGDAASGKIVERIGGGQAARPATPAPGTQTNQQAQTAPVSPAKPTTPSTAPAIAVAQRAALLVDAPDEPQKVRTFVGNVVWRLDNVSRGQGQPLSIGVRAEVDLPDAKLRAVMLIQKNTDDTLPASHTIELRFIPTEGGPIPGVAQISTPQMRKEDTPAGDALTGVPAPIMQNYFLVGLTRGDAAVSRNVDLMRTRAWFDIPMLLSDQRIAKITFEKGSAGERVINEALEAWQK
ncbi:MAG: uncharacterized protein JWM36_304 [Hyphomicrobiales bacterium]|nr:uncharacterized protein [Hyphomicrobiales bacterium]